MDAIDNGVAQGVKIGNWIVDKTGAPQKTS
jgi:hypothetical protein